MVIVTPKKNNYYRNMIIFFIFCFLSFITAFPIIVVDADTEIKRLSYYYTWMTPKIYYAVHYNSMINDLNIDDIAAIIQSESEGNPLAVSYAGAIGLMQVMPFNHRGPRQDLFVPEINVYEGCQYYKYCLDLANSNKRLALVYYNAGPACKIYRNWAYVNTICRNSERSSSIFFEMERM